MIEWKWLDISFENLGVVLYVLYIRLLVIVIYKYVLFFLIEWYFSVYCFFMIIWFDVNKKNFIYFIIEYKFM